MKIGWLSRWNGKGLAVAKSTWAAGLLVPAWVAMTACATADAPVTNPEVHEFKPVVSINEVMVGTIDHNAHFLWDVALPDKAPKTDMDWHNLEHAAITLASMGDVLTIGGSGAEDAKWVADPEWKKMVQEQTSAAVDALTAVRAHDQEKLLAAGDRIVQSCENCHMKFKPALPGIRVVEHTH